MRTWSGACMDHCCTGVEQYHQNPLLYSCAHRKFAEFALAFGRCPYIDKVFSKRSTALTWSLTVHGMAIKPCVEHAVPRCKSTWLKIGGLISTDSHFCWHFCNQTTSKTVIWWPDGRLFYYKLGQMEQSPNQHSSQYLWGEQIFYHTKKTFRFHCTPPVSRLQSWAESQGTSDFFFPLTVWGVHSSFFCFSKYYKYKKSCRFKMDF